MDVSIGDHVRIAQGVIILTHDYSWSVLKRYSGTQNHFGGAICGSSGKVKIGNTFADFLRLVFTNR